MNELWRRSIDEVKQILKLEKQATEGLKSKNESNYRSSTEELFEVFVKLYVGYGRTMKQLDKVYHEMIQPQKRKDVRSLLEVVMAHFIEVKHMLHLKAPSSGSSHNSNDESSLSYSSAHIAHVANDDIQRVMHKLKLEASSVGIYIPKLLLQDRNNLEEQKARDDLIQQLFAELASNQSPEELAGTDEAGSELPDDDTATEVPNVAPQTLVISDGGLDELKRNNQSPEESAGTHEAGSELPDDDAATEVPNVAPQTLVISDGGLDELKRNVDNYPQKMESNDNGSMPSIRISTEKEEYTLVEPPLPAIDGAVKYMDWLLLNPKEKEELERYYATKEATDYEITKKDQAKHQQLHDEALLDMEQQMRRDEGRHISAQLQHERMAWIEELIQGKYDDGDDNNDTNKNNKKLKGEAPENMDGFYLPRTKQGMLTTEQCDGENNQPAKDVDDDPDAVWVASGEGRIERLKRELKIFKDYWDGILDNPSCDRDFVADMARERGVRPTLTEELRKDVDADLNQMLARTKEIQATANPVAKTKKKASQKKGAKGKASGRATKGAKKEKPLPGSKIPELKAATTRDMLKCLARHGIIANCKEDSGKDNRLEQFISDPFSTGYQLKDAKKDDKVSFIVYAALFDAQ
jgi:hypothetical protein